MVENQLAATATMDPASIIPEKSLEKQPRVKTKKTRSTSASSHSASSASSGEKKKKKKKKQPTAATTAKAAAAATPDDSSDIESESGGKVVTDESTWDPREFDQQTNNMGEAWKDHHDEPTRVQDIPTPAVDDQDAVDAEKRKQRKQSKFKPWPGDDDFGGSSSGENDGWVDVTEYIDEYKKETSPSSGHVPNFLAKAKYQRTGEQAWSKHRHNVPLNAQR